MYHNHRKINRICMLEEMQLLPLEIREKRSLPNARSKNKLQKHLVPTLTNYGLIIFNTIHPIQYHYYTFS